MDGAMIAFHNTQEIFGFQYVPLSEMDLTIFGSIQYAEKCFYVSLKLLNELLDMIVERFPEKVFFFFFF